MTDRCRCSWCLLWEWTSWPESVELRRTLILKMEKAIWMGSSVSKVPVLHGSSRLGAARDVHSPCQSQRSRG